MIKLRLSYRTVGDLVVAYAVGMLASRLLEIPSGPFERNLLIVQVLLVPTYLVAGFALRKQRMWGKRLAITAGAFDLIALLASEGLPVLFAQTLMSWPFRLLPLSELIFRLALVGTGIVLVALASSEAGYEPSAAERLAGLRRGRVWFWWTVGLYCFLPVMAGAVWLDTHYAHLAEGRVVVFGPGVGMLLIRESLALVFFGFVIRAIMSAPLWEHGMSITARKIMAGVGIAVTGILIPILWYTVFTITMVPLTKFDFEHLQLIFLLRMPGSVGTLVVMCGLIAIGVVLALNGLSKLAHPIEALHSQASP